MVPPVVGDLDGLVSARFVVHGVALLVRVQDQLLYELGVVRVHHVVEVLAVGHAPLRQLRREVLHELCVVPHLHPDLDHRQFVVEWHVDPRHVLHLHEHLVLDEHLLQEVLVHHVLRRQVQLH